MSEWRFLIDENLEPQIATQLEKRGLAAEAVRDSLERGADDAELLRYARKHDAIVVTLDEKDFATISYEDHEGILVLRNGSLSAYQTARAISDLVSAYDEHTGRDGLRHREPLDEWV
jgi:predicted nuclease of predicted toxin-antitoxin system